ncbi:hypothetical protein LRR81_14370 [Metabacillus sp. GX 13764]|uniref:hypothetical protein n=1 Tax=Metabacillus kandeliae TaxID=2900151 RepID=UPI001E28C7A4|nr:hypothetical protein [Metabacillus kandeliae]MCD7035427.1 hypothetical protein [Metabacillus kandeliae]
MENSITYPFLQSLIGRTIRVYKGGPESKTGLLADVKEDFLVLSTKENGVIYYAMNHLKSIVEDSHAPMNAAGAPVLHEVANTFTELLASLIHKVVRVNQGGPESKSGRLLAVKEDHIVVAAEGNEIIYYATEHIRSVSETADKKAAEWTEFPAYLEALNLPVLLYGSKHQWLTINRGGPESLDGILVEVLEDHIVLVHNEKIFRVAPYHIKSISIGARGKKQNSDSGNENNESKSQEKNESSGQDKSQSSKQENKNNGSKDWSQALLQALAKESMQGIAARLNEQKGGRTRKN